MTLQDLARRHGRNLAQLGIAKQTGWAISSGAFRAGPKSIARIAATLGVPATEVANACDASWNAKRAASAPDAPSVPPSANGAQVEHAADVTPAVPA